MGAILPQATTANGKTMKPQSVEQHKFTTDPVLVHYALSSPKAAWPAIVACQLLDRDISRRSQSIVRALLPEGLGEGLESCCFRVVAGQSQEVGVFLQIPDSMRVVGGQLDLENDLRTLVQ